MKSNLFVNCLGDITPFIARWGIADLSEGVDEYPHQEKDYHDNKVGVQG